MEVYASGQGHVDLAQRLDIANSTSLAIGGSANSRIIRTTVKDSYATTEPTLYVLGMTFVSRNEIPILRTNSNELTDTSFEGRWTNPQNQLTMDRWEHFWQEKDTDRFVDLMLKAECYSILDRAEDLMYRFLSLINDLNSRGHQVVIYNQADSNITSSRGNMILADAVKLQPLKSRSNFVHGLTWQAIPWQHSQGVAVSSPSNVINKYGEPPADMKHRMPGEHAVLNEYLVNYIKSNQLV
jgi:hypothetical protein